MADSTVSTGPAAGFGGKVRSPSALVARLVAGAIILCAWEIVVRTSAPAFVAKPSMILIAIPRVLVDPAFLAAAGATLAGVVEGLAIALVGGTIIGLAIGRSSLIDRTLRLYVNVFYAMPMLVVVPLFALWFGYTGAARLVTVIFASVFSIIVNVADGARAVPQEYVEVARSFRSAPLRTLFDVVLPAATPYLLAGLRLAAGRALIGAVVAEFITAVSGIGYFILYNSRTYHENEAFVGVLVLAAFGVGFESLVGWCTRRFLPWYRRELRGA
ncbi:MAG: ABC transporter permease [Xanthobacteraceae bacterium]